jgi:dimethylhistidine N-methyltransferase
MLKDKNISLSKELLLSLLKKKKIIPSKFHYDYKGSKYFQKITKTKEYYITRIEKNILKKIAKEIDFIFGEDLTFVEFGSGSSEKIRILLNDRVKYYVPLDISFDFINQSSKKLFKSFPKLKTLPTYCDYTKYIKLPKNISKAKIGFFLGSSIGNFYNKEERKFLKNAKKTLGKNSFLFVGVDLIKNIKILKKAYDDKGNFTAKFNLNLINIINKKVRTRLKVKDFKYIATFNKKKSSMENFIVSKKKQIFFINMKKFYLKKNEKIQTEISKKFTISKFSKLAKSSGWRVQKYWKDAKKYYAVFLLQS